LIIPNERSSHTRPTIRGGGIIFPLAVFLWGLFFEQTSWGFITAVTMIGIVGFLDDRYSLSQWVRLLVQSVAVIVIIWQANIIDISVVWLIVSFILITGWLNAFNFMDGINGMSAFYALVVLIGIWLFNDEIAGIENSLMITVALSLILFSWFNARKKAVIFAGDIGSLSMGIILAYLVMMLIVSTGRWEFILLVCVYGADTVLTIVHRVIKEENIFEAHRSHLYQYLANEAGLSHLKVSWIYSLLQLSITLILFHMPTEYAKIYALAVCINIGIIYIVSKYLIIRTYDNR